MEELYKIANAANRISNNSPTTPSSTQHKRHEARENAKRDRQGGDWFRHDQTNISTTPLLSEYGGSFTDASSTGPVTPLRQKECDIADYRKCLSRSSGYSPSPSRQPPTNDGLRSLDRINSASKVQLRFDDTPDQRVFKTPLSVISNNSAGKLLRSNPNDWFRHDQKSPDLNKAVDEEDLIAALDEIDDDNSMRIVSAGAHAKSIKLEHTSTDSRVGCSCGGDWFLSHNSGEASSKTCSHVYRVHPKEGELNPSLRTAQESESWFDYEANKNYFSPLPLARGAGVPSLLNRERSGQQMSDILHMK